MTFTNTLPAPTSSLQLAQLLQQQRPDYQSGKTPLAGFANMLTEILGAKNAKTRQDQTNAAMSEALKVGMGSPAGLDAKTGITWDQAAKPDKQAMIDMLMNNPNTSNVGQQIALNQIGTQQDIEDEVAKAKALMPIKIQEETALAKAKMSAMGGSKVMSDAMKLSETLGVDLGTAYSIAKSGLGVGNTMSGGVVAPISGNLETHTATKAADEMGTKSVDLQMNPVIASKTAEQTELGKALGEKGVALQDQTSQLPRLEDVAKQLSDLGKKATYTTAGNVVNAIKRETGLPVGEGAIAKAEYISKVDNEILPLLRQTFGAQFTAREGDTLRNTLGDPNKSPEEKDAVLRSFIDQKKSQIHVLQNRVGGAATLPPALPGKSVDYKSKYGLQ